MQGIITSMLRNAKLFAIAKNGIRVYEQFGKNGERILTSFKPNSKEIYKQISVSRSYLSNIERTGTAPYRRDLARTFVTSNQTGRQPINIDISTDHWFCNNVPLKSYTYGLKVQPKQANVSWLTSKYNDSKSYLSGTNLYEDNNLVRARYIS